MLFSKSIVKTYKSSVFTRCDGNELLRYLTHEDFPGLSAEEYSFKSSHGHILKGNFYSYEGCKKSPLVIFEHGFGGGHLSYMREIEMLCKKGYYVFSYDHTGCMSSEGENTGGLSQSLCDLDDCISVLKSDENISTDCIYVIGHSWGGFSTLNISAIHPDVKKIVVFSGFVSVRKMAEQNFPGIMKAYIPEILKAEEESNPKHFAFDAIETLKNAKTEALLIYSDDDRLVKKEIHFDILKESLLGKENITLMLEEGKGHNPNYSQNAVMLLEALGGKMKKTKKLKSTEEKKAFRDSFDWFAITEQDEKVWKKIFEFLK